MEDEPSLREGINKLNKSLEVVLGNGKKVKKLQKNFKLPFGKTFGSSAKIKKGYCLVASVLNNGSVDINWYQINDGIIKLKNGLGYAAGAQYILNYKGKPFMIVPEWSEEPFSPQDHFEKVLTKGELSYPQRVMVELAERKALKLDVKKKFGNVWLFVILGVVGLVLAYVLFSGGGIGKIFGGG